MPYTSDPVPRPVTVAPPAPLREFLASVRHGVDAGYVVLPRSLAESMPPAWQQQLAHLMAELHQTYGHLPWPVYRVVPSRYELLADLDDEQLAEVGYLAEIDSDGELRYRDREGRVVEDPEQHEVLVSCLDPIPQARVASPGMARPTVSSPVSAPMSSPVWPTP